MSQLHKTVVQDQSIPTVPTGLTATAVSESQINLAWNVATDPDTGVGSYRIYADGVPLAQVTVLAYQHSALDPYSSHSYAVSAVDKVGNESAQSPVASARTMDLTPPTVPSGLVATPFAETQINLAWSASSDPYSGVSGYKVYRDGAYIATTPTNSYQDKGVTAYSLHSYTASALDGPGNESAQCAAVSARSLDTTAPSVPTGLAATPVSTTEIDLSWSASTDGGSGVANYEIYRGPTLIATQATRSFQDTGLTPNTSYAYQLLAIDNSGNRSAKCTAVNASTQSQQAGAPGAAIAIYAGFVSSTAASIEWWGPPEQTGFGTYVQPSGHVSGNGTPDHWIVYRDGVRIYGNTTPYGQAGFQGVSDDPNLYGVGHKPQPWFCDVGLTPNTTYTYYVTAVSSAGIEGPASPSITIKTLATRVAPAANTPPDPTLEPNTWIAPYALPAAGTTWLATATTAFDQVGTAGPTGKNSVGCGLRYALNNCDIDGGDVIVVTAGATYTCPPYNGWPIRAFTGLKGWTYLVSSEDPGYKAGGKLLPYSYTPTPNQWEPLTCTAPIALGAVGATLQSAWTRKTGLYYVQFSDGQERLVLFTQNSAALDWTNYNDMYRPSAPTYDTGVPGLTAAVSATIDVNYTAGVTPTDLPNMATLQFNTDGGFNFTHTTTTSPNKVRFVGINLRPVGQGFAFQFDATATFETVLKSAESVYIDRCIIGQDGHQWHGLAAGNPNFSYWRDAFGPVNCDHFLVHQTYVWGEYFSNTEVHGFWGRGGGPMAIQNTFIEAQTIGIFFGGAYFHRDQFPHDFVLRWSTLKKPKWWCLTTPVLEPNAYGAPNPTIWSRIGAYIKNFCEAKGVVRFEAYGNLVTDAPLQSAGYHAAAFQFGPLDQLATSSYATHPSDLCPWNRCTDINIHDNMAINVGLGYSCFTDGTNAGNYACRQRFANNIVLVNPTANTACEVIAPLRLEGPVTDITIEHNTVLINMAMPKSGTPSGIWLVALGSLAGGFANPAPYGPNPYPPCDRVTITDNIIDGITTWFADAGGSWSSLLNKYIDCNMSVSGSAAPIGRTWQVPYASIGMRHWVSATTLPHVGDWDVTSGTYATAATDGSPLGATYDPTAMRGRGTAPPEPPIVLALPNGAAGTAYSVDLAALNSEASDYTSWTLVAVSSNKKAVNGVAAAPAPSNTYSLSNGILSITNTPTVQEIDYIQVTASGAAGTVTRNYVAKIGTAGTNPVLLAGPVALGHAGVNRPFAASIKAVGASAITYSLSAHTGPNTYTVSPAGVISGTPTVAGTDSITVQAADGVHPTVTQTYYVTAVPYATGAPRLAAQTGSGWFVRDGELYEPNGNAFRIRGVNRTHCDSNDSFWTAANRNVNGNFNTVRWGTWESRASFPESYTVSRLQSVVIGAHCLPVYARWNQYANSGTGPTVTGAQTVPPLMGAVYDWYTNYSTWAPVMDKLVFNPANEWGPPAGQGAASAVWKDANKYVACDIDTAAGAISGTTLRMKPGQGGASNPFTSCQFGLIKGATGVADQMVAISAPGGALATGWTVTINTISLNASGVAAQNAGVGPGNGTGGTLYGGTLGVYRGAGYLNALMIDSGQWGQSWSDLETYATEIFNSDPQQNVIFDYHLYGDGGVTTLAGLQTHLINLAAIRAATGACFVIGEVGPYQQGSASSLTQLLPSEWISACEAYGFGYMAWSPDDNTLANSGSDDASFAMMYCAGGSSPGPDTGKITNKTTWGKTFLLDPIYGTCVNARAPTSL